MHRGRSLCGGSRCVGALTASAWGNRLHTACAGITEGRCIKHHPVRAGFNVLCTAIACFGAGCTTRIVPPAELNQPVRVYLIDCGYHSSLILPDESGIGREFAFGEYGWFANNRDSWLDAIRLMLVPCEGALGVRDYPAPLTPETIAMYRWFQSIHELVVERAAVTALRLRLDECYRLGAAQSVIYNRVVDLWFVRDARLYWMGHNCNHATLEWVEELGCEIRGPRAIASFEIRRQSHRTSGSRALPKLGP